MPQRSTTASIQTNSKLNIAIAFFYNEDDTLALRHYKGRFVNNPLIKHLNFEISDKISI